jgi:hypothetical protein
MDVRDLWGDLERPDLGFTWRERVAGAGGCETFAIIDFVTIQHSFRMEFLTPRTGKIAHAKTTGIVGFGPTADPNVIASFTQDEIAGTGLNGLYVIRLTARAVSDSKDRGPFGGANMPMVRVHPIPVLVTP